MEIGRLIGDAIGNVPNVANADIGDYYNADGVLVCGKCNEPKEIKVKLNGVIETKRCSCRCDKERKSAMLKEQKRQEEEAVRQTRISMCRYGAFPEPAMEHWTFDADDKNNSELTDLARRYAENFNKIHSEGMGLLLYGTVGTGKTFISACIANAVIDQEYSVLVTSFPRLCNKLFSTNDKQSYLDSLNGYDLLVIDDLGVERDTEYMGELVQSIVDSRYRARKPIIVTTNLTGDELKHPKDIRNDRVYSRLFEMCYPFEVKGKDRRKLKLKENSKRFKSLLGYED